MYHVKPLYEKQFWVTLEDHFNFFDIEFSFICLALYFASLSFQVVSCQAPQFSSKREENILEGVMRLPRVAFGKSSQEHNINVQGRRQTNS